jgi:excisionase family DNA binding protein
MILYDISQAAKELRIAPITVRRLIRAGEIPYHRFGGKYVFTQEDLNTFVETSAVPAKGANRE